VIKMTWEDLLKQDRPIDETIRVGDYIYTDGRGKTRGGVIDSITIAMDKNDVAGNYDSGVEVERYDLKLDYDGSVSYGGNWCYFRQIKKVVSQDDPEFQEIMES
jgi:hypothetical protein